MSAEHLEGNHMLSTSPQAEYVTPPPATRDGAPSSALHALHTDSQAVYSAGGQHEHVQRDSHAFGWKELRRTLTQDPFDAVAVLDRGGTIRYETAAVERLVGISPEELVGTNICDWVHPDDASLIRDWLNRLTSRCDGTPEVEYRHRTADGSYRWIASAGLSVTGNPNVQSLLVRSRCATEHRVRQNQLEQNERLSSLGRLAATVAHEFNNVLMGIQPFAEVIARAANDTAPSRAAAHILRSVSRGRSITQELLRFTHAAEPILAHIDVRQWLDQVAVELRGIV